MVYITVDLFFFKQKTAYEMRISDWSSDVCSSDLIGVRHRPRRPLHRRLHHPPLRPSGGRNPCRPTGADVADLHGRTAALHLSGGTCEQRSEERRVGKECVSTCRSRWSPYHYKKNNIHFFYTYQTFITYVCN